MIWNLIQYPFPLTFNINKLLLLRIKIPLLKVISTVGICLGYSPSITAVRINLMGLWSMQSSYFYKSPPVHLHSGSTKLASEHPSLFSKFPSSHSNKSLILSPSPHISSHFYSSLLIFKPSTSLQAIHSSA